MDWNQKKIWCHFFLYVICTSWCFCSALSCGHLHSETTLTTQLFLFLTQISHSMRLTFGAHFEKEEWGFLSLPLLFSFELSQLSTLTPASLAPPAIWLLLLTSYLLSLFLFWVALLHGTQTHTVQKYTYTYINSQNKCSINKTANQYVWRIRCNAYIVFSFTFVSFGWTTETVENNHTESTQSHIQMHSTNLSSASIKSLKIWQQLLNEKKMKKNVMTMFWYQNKRCACNDQRFLRQRNE